MELSKLEKALHDRFPERLTTHISSSSLKIECSTSNIIEVSAMLFNEKACAFAGMIIEEEDTSWSLRYMFYNDHGMIQVTIDALHDRTAFPSISAHVHAADWHERAAEDLFGLSFTGHPRLGEFVLHEQWPEGTNPMRHGFDARASFSHWESRPNWEPPRVFDSPGAFSMPIGPIYSGVAESVHFQLETIGEEIVRVIPRLFYKYRAVEKLAQGRPVSAALLLAERFNGTSSFAHTLAFCRAVEGITQVEITQRARRLRVFLAELERLRHHVAAIQGICSSTGLAVAASQAGILEEEMLRLSGVFAGHRYLFGLAAPGGLTRDFTDEECYNVASTASSIVQRLNKLERLLTRSSSFLDRLERVGIVTKDDALRYGLVGPIARASGSERDLRTFLPYSGYEELSLAPAKEEEGDGYARLRVLFSEARESVRLLTEIATDLPPGDVRAAVDPRAGAALAWTEAPRGAAFHWVRIDDVGNVVEWRIIPPSFANWHGFHLAAEGFAFQDFPIILATFGLSAAENDR